MNSNFVIRLALSTACAAVPAMIASTAGFGSTDRVSAQKAGPEKANRWAKKAEQALAKGKIDRALIFAELAVEADMQNRSYRGLLARIYMAQGRFLSAERSLNDVIDLGQVDPRTIISLALARIAQGDVDSAASLVEAKRAMVPVSDYGLILALAGHSAKAINILTDVIRTGNATSRTRQNLALAFALDGRWRDARIMASQDMAQDKVNERIAEWAQFARPGAYTLRVAGLLKVRPNMADSGQPVRLALTPVAPVGLAQAGAAPVVAPVEPAAIGSVPVAGSAGFAVAETEVEIAPSAPAIPLFEAPLIKAAAGPVKSAPTALTAPTKLATANAPAAKPASVGGTHLVQLGAFSSATNARAAWNRYSKRFDVLKGLGAASSTVTINGKKLIRLAASGFENVSAANAACKQIKAHGGACFVRTNGGAQPVRMAHAAGRWAVLGRGALKPKDSGAGSAADL